MKAFIFVALVASVAARGLDLDTLRLIREKSLLKQGPVVDELLLKEKLGQRVPLVEDIERSVLPVERHIPVEREHNFRGIYDIDRVYTFEELYQTELFREYLQIPLFRQYIQYPSFQRYVASVYFQRFWQIPTFRQYFLNPVLFYKYIYPIVQLHQYENNYYPVVGGQDLEYGQDFVGRQTYDDLVIRNKNVFPYVYGQEQDVYNRYGLPATTGQTYPWNYYNSRFTQGVNHKFLLDKVYRHLVANSKPVVGEIKTDVQIPLPAEKKVVVEPVTGERKVVVEEPKVVDVKIDEKVVPIHHVIPEERPVVDTIARDQFVREQILKELIKEKYVTPEVYEQLRDILPTIRREGRQSFDITRRDQEVYNPFVTRREQEIYTPYVNRPVHGDRYNYVNQLYNQLYNEIPAIRERNVYDRLPLQQILGNIVA